MITQKACRKFLRRYIAGSVCLIVIAAALGGLFLFKTHAIDAAPAPKPAVAAAVQSSSEFSFSGVTGWTKGPTNKTSMALFSTDRSCFVYADHKTGTVDVASELQKDADNTVKLGGTRTDMGIVAVTVQTPTGPQQYDLHQYSLVGTSLQLKGGEELGYVQLANGYLKMEGDCDTAQQLASTVPGLEAVTFRSLASH